MMFVALDLPAAREVSDSHQLAGAWAKYNRGVSHFKELVTVARRYMRASSGSSTVEQRRIDPLVIGFFAKMPPVGLEIANIVGDVAHGLRSALDHAAWAMATKKDRDVGFPICDTRKEFRKLSKGLRERHAPTTVESFEKYQPYHDRNGLAWIRDINNVDKHEAVVVVRHRLEIRSLLVTDSLTGEVLYDSATRPAAPPLDVTDGSPVFKLQQAGPGTPRLSIKVDFENSLALASGRSWPQDRLDLILRQALHDVEETLWGLQQVIDGPAEEDEA